MGQRLLALLVVVAAAVVAAGGGAYLALRQQEPASRSNLLQPTGDRDATRNASAEAGAPPAGAPRPAQPVAGGVPASPPAVNPVAVNEQARQTGRTRPARRTDVPEPAVGPKATTAQAASPGAVGNEPTAAPAAPLPPPAPVPAPTLPEPVPVAPPEPEFVDVTVPAEAVIGLQMSSTVASDRAQVEDRVEARVTRDVRADGRIAIPAGSRMEGVVTVAEPGGKIKERARLAVRFHTLVLADGTRVPVVTESIYREGESPAPQSSAKIGGAAVGGALLGAILGGGKGAAIGGSIGAAGGTAMAMAGSRNPAVLPAGANVTVRLHAPVTIAVER